MRRYLRADLDEGAARARLAARLADREGLLLDVLRRGVYARPGSPYRALLLHAGIEDGDAAALVRGHGVEGALRSLLEAGIVVRAEELKGRRPIVRPGLELAVRPGDFDNPLVVAGYRGSSSGATGTPVQSVMSFDDLALDVAHHLLWIDAFGVRGRPVVLWRAVPPSRAGLRNALRVRRAPLVLDSWFTPTPTAFRRLELADWVALRAAWTTAFAYGRRLPWPRHVPVDRPAVVARRLALLVQEGRPAVLDATAASCVRACRAAAELGLDLAGTLVRTGGEPLTEGKLAAIQRVGARACCHYSMAELGRSGVGCAAPVAIDDVHLLTDRVAVIPEERGHEHPALLITSLAATPKLLLNADVGDTGVLEERDCGCALGEAGLRLHLHTIRSPAKLTSEGTNLLADDVLTLVERVLPGRFGGGPNDYQLVEDEHGGLPRVTVLVSPRVGAVAEDEVVEAVLGVVGTGPGWRAMTADLWRAGSTLTVERREPASSRDGKVPALVVTRR